ncbi:hypothetical protein D3C73_1328210 [compost metagenome]
MFILPQLLNAGTFLIELILNLSDNLFHNVFQGNHAGRAAIFINQNGNLRLGTLHDLEERTDLNRFRNRKNRTDKFIVLRCLFTNQILNMNKAKNVVLIAVTDRIARAHAVKGNLQVLFR